jgi:peptidoglycan/xylan/chitin deacetylase (PgdA/CDA1 family)
VITSIYFHNPGRRLFTKVISWLESNGYTFISADQLIDILNMRAVCPKGAVWISLDDGWKGNLDHVIPVAEEHNVPITIFVYTAGVEEGSFWWEDLKRYANRLPAELRQIEAIIGQSEDTRKQVLKLIAQANAQSGVRWAV